MYVRPTPTLDTELSLAGGVFLIFYLNTKMDNENQENKIFWYTNCSAGGGSHVIEAMVSVPAMDCVCARTCMHTHVCIKKADAFKIQSPALLFEREGNGEGNLQTQGYPQLTVTTRIHSFPLNLNQAMECHSYNYIDRIQWIKNLDSK